jgi:hypothetical protein
MMTPDLALALLINRSSEFYQNNAPLYMTYVEHTRVSAPTLGRAQDIDRSVMVRVGDNLAVMQDLPNGGQRVGQAFPIIPFFDPFSNFKFSYFANLKRVDIMLDRGAPFFLPIPPPDPTVNVVVPYNSFWAARYATDSTDSAIHLLIEPTARVRQGLYPADVAEDASSHLPSHIEMRVAGASDEVISLDYSMLDGHWVITHGTFSQTMHVAFLTYKIIADVTYSQITFPTEAPDPRLAGTPAPTTSP